jgi:hypothetical protein
MVCGQETIPFIVANADLKQVLNQPDYTQNCEEDYQDSENQEKTISYQNYRFWSYFRFFDSSCPIKSVTVLLNMLLLKGFNLI